MGTEVNTMRPYLSPYYLSPKNLESIQNMHWASIHPHTSNSIDENMNALICNYIIPEEYFNNWIFDSDYLIQWQPMSIQKVVSFRKFGHIFLRPEVDYRFLKKLPICHNERFMKEYQKIWHSKSTIVSWNEFLVRFPVQLIEPFIKDIWDYDVASFPKYERPVIKCAKYIPYGIIPTPVSPEVLLFDDRHAKKYQPKSDEDDKSGLSFLV